MMGRLHTIRSKNTNLDVYVSSSVTHPSDDLADHTVPVAMLVHGAVPAVLHHVHLVPEAQLVGERGDQVDAVSLLLGVLGHDVRLLLRKQTVSGRSTRTTRLSS